MHKLFLLLFIVSVSFGQSELLTDTTFSVNSIKLHYREYLVAKSENEYSYNSTLVELDILDSFNIILQEIKIDIYSIGSPLDTKDGYCVLGDSGITLDYNFDGFEDLAIRIGNGANNHAVNGYFYIYLFNPETKKFSLYEEELINPLPNPERKQVECTFVNSTLNPDELIEYYKWLDGKLTISESVRYQQLFEQPEKDVILTKEIRIFYKDGDEIRKIENILRYNIN